MRPFAVIRRPGPVIAVALHAGHELRPDIAGAMALAEEAREREEDPATDRIADFGATLVTVGASRFQVDLNRIRESAVYRVPADAWGLDMWSVELGEASIAASLAEYDAFYDTMRALVADTIRQEGCAVIFDVHSYNHRRGGPGEPPASAADNPEINVGTGSMDRVSWEPVVTALCSTMTGAGYDVRENVRFQGGAFDRWVHETFPRRACAIAIEFKKTFMDEWTGEIDEAAAERASEALEAAAARVADSLGKVTL